MLKKEKKEMKLAGCTTPTVHEMLRKYMNDENRTESATIHIALKKFLTEYYANLNTFKK